MTNEVWRVIPMFRDYEISNEGRVRRRRRAYAMGAQVGRILKPWRGVGGELYVSLRADGATHPCVVSSLLAAAFPRRRAS